jgi:phosphoglycolate phosphatase
MTMAKPAAVLFDWDNTLVDSWGVIGEALNHTFAEMGYPAWTPAEIRERVRHSLATAFPALFGERWTEARQLYLGRFEAIHLDRLTPLPDAENMVRSLAAEGLYLAVVSNKTGRLLRREVAALGWDGHFSRIVGAGDAAADKPDRAPIDLALDGSGIVAGEAVWYVGDTGIDVQCALNSGCVPVVVHDADDEPVMAYARHRFPDLPALGQALCCTAPCNPAETSTHS